jgi:PAS domain S-box-containing protein
LLLVEHSVASAELVRSELETSGYDVSVHHVQTAAELTAALAHGRDVVVCELEGAHLDARSVLEIVRGSGADVPVIVISGALGDETAVEIMRRGASDYLVKDKLARLGPAVRRELGEVQARAARREADLARKQADASFRLIVESSPDLVVVHRSGDILYVNPKTLERLGYADLRALAAMPLSAIVVDRDTRAPRTPRPVALETDRPAPVEQRWKCHDGAILAVEVVRGPVVFEGALATVLIARDLTERNQLAATMIEMDRMATIGTLAAGVGHEINNPLAYVLANLEFVTGEIDALLGELPPASRDRLAARIADLNQALADTNHGAERVRAIVQDLRSFSRATDDVVAPVDVRQILDASVRMAAVQIRHRATIVKDYAEVPAVLANESRLGQVFLNLIVNASQALPEGPPASNRIELRVRLEGDLVTVTVADTGAGIPEDILPRVFEPFFTTKSAGQGTGLGLGICRRIVAQLHGEISVASEVGVGTRFFVRLPRAAADWERSLQRADSALAVAPRRARILCVDDGAELGLSLRRAFQTEHELVVLTNAKDALACVEAGERIDVIVCDVMMPDMSGMALYAELETLSPELLRRVVFLTQGARSAEARAFLDRVKNPRLARPIDVEELRSAFAQVLSPG